MLLQQCTCRDLIPTHPENRKLSKIETLRLATSYIHHLAATLEGGHHHHLLLLQGHHHHYRQASPEDGAKAAPVCTFCLRCVYVVVGVEIGAVEIETFLHVPNGHERGGGGCCGLLSNNCLNGLSYEIETDLRCCDVIENNFVTYFPLFYIITINNCSAST
jgi:hypothetical protein